MEKVKIAVMGVGRMGSVICHGMSELGHYVVGLDTNEEAAERFRKHIDAEEGVFYNCGGRDYKEVLGQFEDPEVVISSLPYHQNESLAEFCIDRGIRYCDLGGRVDISKNINNYAEEHAEKPVMTDLGLAPGLVNILAEEGRRRVHGQVDSVKMMVGGLPAMPTNPPLNYTVTWSIDGLLNEYRDDCEVLIDSEVQTVKGMEGLEEVSFKWLPGEELEAFYTSGGAAHTINAMKAQGVKDCSYKTIRYKGHRDTVRFLIRNAGLSDECLERVFKQGCGEDAKDVILLKVEVVSGDLAWSKEIIIGHDLKFSGMQKATAFPICSVASLMAEGYFDDRKEERRGYHKRLPIVLNYNDVPSDKFKEKLQTLGLSIDNS